MGSDGFQEYIGLGSSASSADPLAGGPARPAGGASRSGNGLWLLGRRRTSPEAVMDGPGSAGPALGGRPLPVRLARSGLAPCGLAITQTTITQTTITQATSRTGRLPFGTRREHAAWRNHPVLSGDGSIHPGQFAGGLLGRFPGRVTGRPGSAHRVQPVRGTERPHRFRRGVALPARGRTVCVCAPAHRGVVPARGTARRTVAA